MTQCDMCGAMVDAVTDEHICFPCKERWDNRTRYPRDSEERYTFSGRHCYLIMDYCKECKASLLWVDSDDEGAIFMDLASGEWHSGEWRVHNEKRCADVQSNVRHD